MWFWLTILSPAVMARLHGSTRWCGSRGPHLGLLDCSSKRGSHKLMGVTFWKVTLLVLNIFLHHCPSLAYCAVHDRETPSKQHRNSTCFPLSVHKFWSVRTHTFVNPALLFYNTYTEMICTQTGILKAYMYRHTYDDSSSCFCLEAVSCYVPGCALARQGHADRPSLHGSVQSAENRQQN